MAKIWITGIAGFIGRETSSYAHLQGHDVWGIGFGGGEPLPEPLASQHIESKIDTPGLGRLAVRSGQPDLVIHLAGGSAVGPSFAAPEIDFNLTVTGTSTLYEWLRLNAPDARVVIVSSAAVYGSGHRGKIQENAALSPFSPYGYNKLIMETIARNYGANFDISTLVVRLFSVYGAGLRKQLFWDLCNKFSAGSSVELGGTGEETRDYIHVKDVARLLVNHFDRATPDCPIINGGAGVAVSVSDAAQTLASAWDKANGTKIDLSFSGKYRPGDPQNLVADISNISNMPFKTSIEFNQGIEGVVDWYSRLQKLELK